VGIGIAKVRARVCLTASQSEKKKVGFIIKPTMTKIFLINYFLKFLLENLVKK
jgi:hypothetical protein